MDSDEEFSEFFAANQPPEHRKLKTLFIRKYRDRLERDELDCLAQVLVNVEFLGCSYPKEVMLRIEAMCSDILKEYRSGRKTNARTLVSAQSAIENRNAEKYRRTDQSTANVKSGVAFVAETKLTPIRPELPGNASTEHRKFYRILSSVVGFKILQNDQNDEINYGNSIQKTFNDHEEGQFKEQLEGNRYEVRYNNTLLIEVHSTSARKAKADGVEKVYKLLKNYCPFLTRIADYCSVDNFIIKKDEKAPASAAKRGPETFESQKIGADNIGYRMLKALGWDENKNTDRRIVDPIGLSIKIGRRGLGAETDKNTKLNMGHFRDILTKFKNSGTDFDLVFSPEFSKEERAELHMMAMKLQLSTKSQGQGDDRFLVVRIKKRLTPWEIVNKVRANDPFYSAVWKIEIPELKEYNDIGL